MVPTIRPSVCQIGDSHLYGEDGKGSCEPDHMQDLNGTQHHHQIDPRGPGEETDFEQSSRQAPTPPA
jgi:hypothetical protein